MKVKKDGGGLRGAGRRLGVPSKEFSTEDSILARKFGEKMPLGTARRVRHRRGGEKYPAPTRNEGTTMKPNPIMGSQKGSHVSLSRKCSNCSCKVEKLQVPF